MYDQVEYGHKDGAFVTSTTEEDVEISHLVEATNAKYSLVIMYGESFRVGEHITST